MPEHHNIKDSLTNRIKRPMPRNIGSEVISTDQGHIPTEIGKVGEEGEELYQVWLEIELG